MSRIPALLLALAATAGSMPLLPAHAEQSVEEGQAELAKCAVAPKVFTTENAINLTHSAMVTPLTLHLATDAMYCWDSQVRLFCTAGRCGVFFNAGKYGYDPTGCSQVRIAQQVWSWCGRQPDAIAFAMWPHLRDGVEVATRIARWPGQMSNFRETLDHVQRDKVRAYNASLGQGVR